VHELLLEGLGLLLDDELADLRQRPVARVVGRGRVHPRRPAPHEPEEARDERRTQDAAVQEAVQATAISQASAVSVRWSGEIATVGRLVIGIESRLFRTCGDPARRIRRPEMKIPP
jgi:hypothetical protein